MTVNDVHYQVKLRIDGVDSLTYLDFTPKEIDSFIRQSMDRVISRKVTGTERGQMYDFTKTRVDDLQSIVKTNTQTYDPDDALSPSLTPDEYNVYTISLPEDYLYFVSIDFTIVRIRDPYNGKTMRVSGEPYSLTQFNLQFEDVSNQPYLTKLPFTILDKTVKVLLDKGAYILSHNMRYIPTLPKIDKAQVLTPLGFSGIDNIDLPDKVIWQVIDETVELMINYTENFNLKQAVDATNQINE